MHSDVKFNLFDLIDGVSLMTIDEAICDDTFITPRCDDINKEYEIKDEFNEIRNSIQNILVKRSNIFFCTIILLYKDYLNIC